MVRVVCGWKYRNLAWNASYWEKRAMELSAEASKLKHQLNESESLREVMYEDYEALKEEYRRVIGARGLYPNDLGYVPQGDD